jgi:hypothetical protein
MSEAFWDFGRLTPLPVFGAAGFDRARRGAPVLLRLRKAARPGAPAATRPSERGLNPRVGPGREASAGRVNFPFGGSTSTSAPTGSSARDFLKALSLILVAKPSTPFSFGEVTTVMCLRSPLVVLVTDIGERHEEVLPRREVDLFTQQIEHRQQSPLRNLPFFLDPRSHLPPYLSVADRVRPRRPAPRDRSTGRRSRSRSLRECGRETAPGARHDP